MIDGLRPYPDMKQTGLPWLGDVPAHWDVRRNGRLFVARRETGFPNLPVLEVSISRGVRIRDFDGGGRKQEMADRSKYQRAVRGDIAYNMMRMWQGAVGIAPADGLVSPAYVVARPFSETDAAYYAYLFRTATYMRETDVFSRGIVPDRNRLYWESFKQMPSVYPPIDEQRLIVRFLDWHGAQTASLIRAKKTLIALLNEQKQAIVHRAVTRGLDPSAKFKPSGVPWLGDVPEGWEVVTLRRVIRRAVDGPHHSPNYLDDGIPLLSARNVKSDRWSLDDVKYISDSDYAEFSRRVVPEVGDVLYTKGGTTGVARAVDLPFPFQVWVHIAVLKVIRSKIIPEFLALSLNSPRCYEQAQLFTRGATNQDLGLGRMKDIFLGLPPISAQSEILSFLSTATKTVIDAVRRLSDEVVLVRDFRARLIADVVAGKLDVRAAAANLPEVTDFEIVDAQPNGDEPQVDLDQAEAEELAA